MPLMVHIIDYPQRNPWLEDQIDYFNSQGIHQAIFSISGKGPLIAELENKDHIRTRQIDLGLIGFFQALKTLKSWSRYESTIVYAHGHRPSVYALALKILTNVRFVICHHHPPRWFSEFSKNAFFKAKFHLTLARIYYLGATRIQSFSLEVFNELMRLKVPESKIVRIPLGMNFDKVPTFRENHAYDKSFSKILIVSISRLAWEKRIDLALQVVAEMINSGMNVEYTIIGTGPDFVKLRNLSTKLGIQESVIFLGWHDDVYSILKKANFFFHLSLTESYGQAIMEARQSGLPILSSQCGVALDMIAANDPAVHFFDCNDPVEIAKIFCGLLGNINQILNKMDEDPRIMYRNHEYYFSLNSVSRLFIELSTMQQ